MPHTRRVFDWFDSNTELFRKRNPQSMLYIGWRRDCKPWWHDTFGMNLGVIGKKDPTSDSSIFKSKVLEIFEPNYNDLDQEVWAGRYEVNPVLGDVRRIDQIWPETSFDIVFWDHGPEHVSAEELKETTEKLKKIAKQHLIYCCPWGSWPQDAEGGNEAERHELAVTEQMFKDMGLTTFTFSKNGHPDQENEGEIVGLWSPL